MKKKLIMLLCLPLFLLGNAFAAGPSESHVTLTADKSYEGKTLTFQALYENKIYGVGILNPGTGYNEVESNIDPTLVGKSVTIVVKDTTEPKPNVRVGGDLCSTVTYTMNNGTLITLPAWSDGVPPGGFQPCKI